MVKNSASRPRSPGSPTKRIWLFKAIAVASPLMLVLGIEFLLRTFGYGYDLRLFVDDPDHPDYWVVNPQLSQRYFNRGENATIGNTEPFRKTKSRDGLRLFVLGESTTLGFPYMHNGSFHRFLQYRLMRMYPNVHLEIINLSLTAVNSFTVRDIGEELTAYSPDAVLIYCGQNEYYGALGVGSTSRLGSSNRLIRAMIFLKKQRLIQLLFNTYSKLPGATNGFVDTRKNLMERMAADQQIPFGSEKYRAGIAQFAQNMNALCSTLSRHHIPVLLSTIVSNEKDLRPFSSGHDQADVLYRKAIEKFNAKDFPSAKQYFIQAKEKDLLRFRAPEAMNREIKSIATRYTSVKLVDSYHKFETASANGIIGNNLLVEHVHPNLAGYALMSDAFYQVLLQAHVLPGKADVVLSLQQLETQMPITAADSCLGKYAIDLLRQRWPFNEKKGLLVGSTLEERLGYAMATNQLKWNGAMDKLMTAYQQRKDTVGVLKVAEAVMLEYALEPGFFIMAGKVSAIRGELSKACNYLNRAFLLQPSLKLAQTLFVLEIQQERIDKAANYLNYGIQQLPGNSELTEAKKLLDQISKLTARVQHQPNPDDYRSLGINYSLLGQEQVSNRYLKLANEYSAAKTDPLKKGKL